MKLYSDIDLRHPVGKESNWQESVVLIFHDERERIFGFLRCGSEPNLGAGFADLNIANNIAGGGPARTVG
jgi:hypothetical protein